MARLAEDGPGGWCDPQRKLIVVADGPANRQIRTLVHELAHALGLGLRARCRFEAGDLLTMRPAQQVYDLVLCRNTVIYFTPDVKHSLHARLAAALVPGGYLMVGSTERISDHAELGLEVAHPFVYRRVS